MANVAATIARGGIWMRPRLTTDEPAPSDRIDLHLNPQALIEAREGMIRVVNSDSGTGQELRRDDLLVAGKTGTAQAARFSIAVRDAAGQPMRDEKGHTVRDYLEPGTRAHPNPRAPWYIANPVDETKLNHAWYMGFAPERKPEIAFAVLVEYGGSGGRTAASIAKELLEGCIRHGYLHVSSRVAQN
jgi:cell division protein FtsI/penicillin-binding protein 2